MMRYPSKSKKTNKSKEMTDRERAIVESADTAKPAPVSAPKKTEQPAAVAPQRPARAGANRKVASGSGTSETRIAFNIPDDQKLRFKTLASLNGDSMTEYMKECIQVYIDKNYSKLPEFLK